MTSHVEGRKDDDLFFEKGGKSYPYLAVLSPDGAVLSQYQGPERVAGFRATMEIAQQYLVKSAQAEKGDRTARADATILAGRLGRLQAWEVSDKLQELKIEPTPVQQRQIDALQASEDVAEIQPVYRREPDPAKRAGLVESELLPLYRKKIEPSGYGTKEFYWTCLLDYAANKKDPKIVAASLTALAPYWDDAEGKARLAAWRARLASMNGSEGGAK